MESTMRIGLNTSQHHCSWPWLLEVWTRADQIDLFESAWTFDHFHSPTEDTYADCLEGWISLTALLKATKRLRGGILVSGMLYRHPSVVANMASSLDIISDGRFELGLGAGWSEDECSAYGIHLGTMSERFDRFEEGLEVIRLLLTRDKSDFSGNWYQLKNAMNNPKPLQQPLPICIGGFGLRRTIPAVAKFATHWNYVHPEASVDDFKKRRQVLNDACVAIGRSANEILISTRISYNGNILETVEQIKEYSEVGVDLGIVNVPKTEPATIVDRLADELSRHI